jgi:hypothetical protein
VCALVGQHKRRGTQYQVFTLTLEQLLDQTKHEYRTYTSVPGRYKAFTAGPHPVWGTRPLIPQRYILVNAQKSGTDILFMPMLLSPPGLTAFIMDEALNELIMGTNPGAAAKLYAATHTHTHDRTHTQWRSGTCCAHSLRQSGPARR